MRIKIGKWSELHEDASRVRHTVFVVEQNVPPELEMDEHDSQCAHVVAYAASGRAVGTGRLLPDAHIGRMAVLSDYRGKGVGSQLLNSLITEARRLGYQSVVLSAQVHAQPFYERHGFVVEGDHYMDAGIEHVLMRRNLA